MEFKIILARAYDARHRHSTVIRPVSLRCYDPFFGFRFIALRCVPILRVAPFGRQWWGGVGVVVIGVSLPFGLGLVLT